MPSENCCGDSSLCLQADVLARSRNSLSYGLLLSQETLLSALKAPSGPWTCSVFRGRVHTGHCRTKPGAQRPIVAPPLSPSCPVSSLGLRSLFGLRGHQLLRIRKVGFSPGCFPRLKR